MSIVIQTGHESSSSAILMELLHSGGLKKAHQSTVQKLSAKKIADTLSKIIDSSQDIVTNKLAENIAVDFLLANIDQDNWGWADSNNLTTLSCWEYLEPSSRFILVFDHPQKIFDRLKQEDLTKDKIDTLMQEWLTYHTVMLQFFDSYQSKCILLEGDFAIAQGAKTKELLRTLCDSLVLQSNWEVTVDANIKKRILKNNESVAHKVIVDEIIRNYPEAIGLFNLLLSKASLKGSSVIYKTKRPEVDVLIAALTNIDNYVIDELNEDLDKKKNIINDLQKKVNDQENLKEESNALVIALHTAQESIEKINIDRNTIQVNTKELVDTNLALEKENSWLVNELHSTQDLLERSYSSNHKISKKNEKEELKNNALSSSAVAIYYSPESRIKNDLPYRLGAAMVKTKTVKDIVLLPAVLTREYRDFGEIKKELESLPALDNQNDILEAEKVKAHLSYKVGSTVIQGLKSPKKLAKLPMNIAKEIIRFKK